jgi:D-glycero-alpha-D-manno-heptose-7-phosphate kinase
VIISRTPVRLSFFGGGTDYREYFERGQGAVLGTTIDKYVYISVNRLSDFFEYKIRVGYSKSELVNRSEDIQHPSVRETLKFMGQNGNLDIHIFADLPARTGLGSSSSFTVGFLNALYALQGKTLPRQQLADEAIHIEQQMIRENVGCQDQVHAAHGGMNIIEFSPKGIVVRPVVISRGKLELLGESLLVFYTSQTRFASEIVKEQVDKTASATNDDYLAEMYRMVFKAEEVITSVSIPETVQELGRLLHQGWMLKKKLSTQISNGLIDQAYDAAMKAGAYGGKLAGAGGGGFLFFLAPKDRHDAIRGALPKLLEVKVGFEAEGSKIIYFAD